MKRHRALAAMSTLLLAVIAGPASTAIAGGPGGDPAAAEALFQRGLDLLKTNDWAGACSAFEASMKLDPSVGTQINLARCADHAGHTAEAWAAFKKAKSLNAETPLAKRKANVDSYVDGEIARLEPTLPWVTVHLTMRAAPGAQLPSTPAKEIPGLALDRDGTAIPIESLDVAVPIDPGPHTFHAAAPGYATAEVRVDFAPKDRKDASLELVSMPPQPNAAVPQPYPATPRKKKLSPLVPAGIAIASVGAATLVVSAVTGGMASSDRGTLDDLVKNGQCTESGGELRCNAASRSQASDAISRGKTLSTVSTVTLFAGAGVAATGVVLAVVGATSHSKKADVAVVPVVGPGIAGAACGGAF